MVINVLCDSFVLRMVVLTDIGNLEKKEKKTDEIREDKINALIP